MNKLKVAVKALRDHLGNDGRGVVLLEELTEIANAQRKRGATLEESLARSEALANELRQECDAARREIDALKQELHRESAKRSAAEARCKALVTQTTPQEEPESDLEERRVDKIWALLRKVRKRYSKLPVQKCGQASGLFVEDFIKAFSHDEFAGLGMVMASSALMNLPLPLRAEHPLRGGDCIRKGEATEHEMAKWVFWFRDAIHTTKLEDELYRRYID